MDRFTVAVTIAVISLVALGVATVAFGVGHGPVGDETTPRGVTLRYLWLLQNGDADRAYDLLAAETRGRISRAQFIRLASFLSRTDRRYAVGEATLESTTARVPVFVLYGGGLFGGGGSEAQVVLLTQESGRWRILEPNEPYLPERPPVGS
ncbi:MAG: hypothetical protein K6U89_09005 [Chloroflexi bacterium]|nr:hypothetical protein [Chloroflexota bacterium]